MVTIRQAAITTFAGWSLRFVCAVLGCAVLGMSCGAPLSEGESAIEPTGQIELALTQVPSDARCLRLTLQAEERAVTRTATLTPGAASFGTTFSAIPVGVAELMGDIFNVACTSVTATSTPTWMSDAVNLTIHPGVTTPITLQMRRPGSVQVGVDFCEGNTCIKPAVDCGGSCVIDGKVCCARRTVATGAVALSCEAPTSCTATPLSTTPESRTPVQCDEHNDCATDQLCSFAYTSTGNEVSCRERQLANLELATGNNYEVCVSPVMAETPCSGGQFCTMTSDALPGWAFCSCPQGQCGDVGAPSVVSITPNNGGTGVTQGTPVQVVFSEPMDATSAAAAVTISTLSANQMTRSWNAAGTVLTITPTTPWVYNSGIHLQTTARTYTVTVATTARDKDGNSLSAAASSTFSTLRRLTLALHPESVGSFSTYGPAVGGAPFFCPTADGNVRVGDHSSAAASGSYHIFPRFDLAELGLVSNIQLFEAASLTAQQGSPTGAYYPNGTVGLGLLPPVIVEANIFTYNIVTNIGTFASSAVAAPSANVLTALNQQWSAGSTAAVLFRFSRQGTPAANTYANFACEGFRLSVQYLTL